MLLLWKFLLVKLFTGMLMTGEQTGCKQQKWSQVLWLKWIFSEHFLRYTNNILEQKRSTKDSVLARVNDTKVCISDITDPIGVVLISVMDFQIFCLILNPPPSLPITPILTRTLMSQHLVGTRLFLFIPGVMLYMLGLILPTILWALVNSSE